MEVVKSKTIHINSKLFPNKPALDEVKVVFPGNEFTKKDDEEEHRLTLVGFNCRRNFYSVNTTNNRFYVANAANAQIHDLQIPTGDYNEVRFVSALTTLLTTQIDPSAVVTFDENKRHLSLDMSGVAGWNATNYFYSLEANNNNTHIILGGKASATQASKVPMFNTDGAGTYTSKFPLTLFSDAELILRASLQSNNFSTTKSGGVPNGGKLVNSQLFGRIPITDLNAEQAHNVKWINYSDSNNNYEIYSQSSALGNIVFQITDSFGRSIKNLHEDPSDDNNLEWTAILKYELLRKKTHVETTLGCAYDNRAAQLIDPRTDLRYP